MARDYDLVDLWLDHSDRLPPELSAIALELLFEDPSRLMQSAGRVDNRKAFIDTVVRVWKERLPLEAEVEAVAAILGPHCKQLPRGGEHTEEVMLRDAPLVYFIVQFTKRARPTLLFSQSFKIINWVLMPHVIRCFPPP
jgi:hypothetical protein